MPRNVTWAETWVWLGAHWRRGTCHVPHWGCRDQPGRQDAVAAANILAGPLGKGALSTKRLAKIQHRREFPAKFTHALQAVMRKQIAGDPNQSGPRRLPWPLRLLESTALPRRMRTRFVSVGIRPEHVETPDMWNSAQLGRVTTYPKVFHNDTLAGTRERTSRPDGD